MQEAGGFGGPASPGTAPLTPPPTSGLVLPQEDGAAEISAGQVGPSIPIAATQRVGSPLNTPRDTQPRETSNWHYFSIVLGAELAGQGDACCHGTIGTLQKSHMGPHMLAAGDNCPQTPLPTPPSLSQLVTITTSKLPMALFSSVYFHTIRLRTARFIHLGFKRCFFLFN